jgi:hypothetical protein
MLKQDDTMELLHQGSVYLRGSAIRGGPLTNLGSMGLDSIVNLDYSA